MRYGSWCLVRARLMLDSFPSHLTPTPDPHSITHLSQWTSELPVHRLAFRGWQSNCADLGWAQMMWAGLSYVYHQSVGRSARVADLAWLSWDDSSISYGVSFPAG